MSARQQDLIENLLPKLAVPASEPGKLDPKAMFDGAEAIWMEIGFGGGEHLVAQAKAHPEAGFIGCEPFIDGMAKALTGIEEAGLQNVRLHMDDAREVISWLSPESLGRVFVLFPDPWPKTRQQKRRLIQPDFLGDLARVLAPGAQVRFATDVRSYADQALEVFLADERYKWTAKTADDWRRAPKDHITTRYESKQLGDIAPVWFDFVFMAG